MKIDEDHQTVVALLIATHVLIIHKIFHVLDLCCTQHSINPGLTINPALTINLEITINP